MARRRFFVPEVRRGTAELTGDDAEHLVRVLRAEVGQIYEISDNHRAYLAQIEVARKSLVSFKVLEELAAAPPLVHLVLVAALFKFDRFEWLVEKTTELGVAEIRPFEAVRTERGLMQAAPKRRARWERIALEAGQQARRVELPEISEPGRFTEALAVEADLKLLLDESAGAEPILKLLPVKGQAGDRVALLLGPEGGWTGDERGAALAAGWRACSLGSTVLRAETAGAAAVAIIQAAWLSYN